MNEERIIQALTAYQGTEESLKETVGILSEELGENWTETVFEKLGGLSVELKDKLNHAFNYYAALMAWQETSGYLEQKTPFDESVKERLPVLKHWLDFFGDSGMELYNQLEEKIHSEPQSESAQKNELSEVQDGQQEKKDNDVQEEVKKEESLESVSQSEGEKSAEEPEKVNENNTEESLSQAQEEEKPTEEVEVKVDTNSPEAFAIQKAKKEVMLLNEVQAWLSARCLQLNNMEVFAYPYYGFVVDLMRQTVKDIQAVLDLEDKSMLSSLYEGGEEAIVRKKQAVEADIETAVQNCESATTALIDENINMDDVRKTLGNLDENPEPEYLGPAPDGFELIQDSDTPLDENAVKEQYQKLEKEVMAETEQEKKTSQNAKNSVQKKLSFSLKPKK